MEKLLILGINTRTLINSALKLNYQTYSSSYYNTLDCSTVYKEKHVLQQKPYQSCGFFEEKFNFIEILNNSSDWIETVDYIVLTTGISPNYFNGNLKLKNRVKDAFNVSKLNNILKKNKKKIIGNKDTQNVENKYKFYKKMKNKYMLPLTFKLCGDGGDDALDIIKQYDDMEFILKDINESGGYGINFLNNESLFQSKEMLSNLYNHKKTSLILQEYIPGDNLSCSVLGTKDDNKAFVVSENINNNYYQTSKYKKDFRYSGNITPIDKGKHGIAILKKIYKLCEDMISDLNLIGSNGIDLIHKDGEINIIEVNPRFQGTYESVEEVFEINLLDAHIKACHGDLIDIPNPKNYSMKKIIYAPKQLKFNASNLQNLNKNITISDIPYENTIIEKNQPMLTLSAKNEKIKNLRVDIEKISNDINIIFK
ncbi:MAG: ATP-grasp domain-containing protein [Methanobrevibacter sp.]|jgi:predicted ATP-grasp superfamily ATP-dependent carboligase|nr:ATP-grasp domain-containing protein [Candidatus Methanovirga meridionalis]